jgi:hypothetical protein
MISSPEEARLLLNKLMIDSSRVLAFASTATFGFLARVEGTITRRDEDGTFWLSSGDNFIGFNLDCIIGYTEQGEMPHTFENVIADEVKKWTTTLLLKYSSGERLALCSMD